MSENKKRSIPEIQAEYQNLALRAGHIQYQIVTMQGDLELLNKSLRDLNLEAAAVKAEEDAKARVDEPSEVKEVPANG